jgi:hypothetical protein
MLRMSLNAATIGLVMSLAKPQRANSEVTRINGKRYLEETTGIFFILNVFYLIEKSLPPLVFSEGGSMNLFV